MTKTASSSKELFADILKVKKDQAAADAATGAVAGAGVVDEDDVLNQEQDDEPDQDDGTEAEAEETENEEVLPAPTEIDMLKTRARLMGLQFSNNIGKDALKAKIQAKLDGESAEEAEVEETENEDAPDDRDAQIAELLAKVEELTSNRGSRGKKPSQLAKLTVQKNARQEMFAEQMKLVRVRITNLNPSKKDLPGEIFTVANRVLGAVKKFIPYGEATENGYHIPQIIYAQLKDREFLNIKTRKDSRGRVHVETKMAREFALEVLPMLTQRELAQLAASQAAASGME